MQRVRLSPRSKLTASLLGTTWYCKPAGIHFFKLSAWGPRARRLTLVKGFRLYASPLCQSGFYSLYCRKSLSQRTSQDVAMIDEFNNPLHFCRLFLQGEQTRLTVTAAPMESDAVNGAVLVRAAYLISPVPPRSRRQEEPPSSDRHPSRLKC